MRLSFTIVATIGLAGSAYAQQANTSLEVAQEFLNQQVANNNTLAVQSGDASGTRQLQVQEAINAANIVLFQRKVVDRAKQISRGEQRANNYYTSAAAQPDSSLRQSGQNLTNYVTADKINLIDQYFGPDALQSINNEAIVSDALGGISQNGINLANIALVNVSIDSGSQAFPETAVQENFNTLSLAAEAIVNDVNQTGMNVGNMLIADRVKNIERVFGGTQIIENELRVASPENLPNVIQQSGTNIANYVSASVVENLTQTSTGSQVVRNSVILGDDTILSEKALSSLGVSYTTTNENIVNFTHVKKRGDNGASDEDSTVSMKQIASIPQAGIRAGGVVQAGNVVVIER